MYKLKLFIRNATIGLIAFQVGFGCTVSTFAERSPYQVTTVTFNESLKLSDDKVEKLEKLLSDENLPIYDFINTKENQNAPITIAEFTAVLVKLNHPQGLVCDKQNWMTVYKEQAIKDGLIQENEFRDMENPITRARAARVLDRYVTAHEKPGYQDWYRSIIKGDILKDMSYYIQNAEAGDEEYVYTYSQIDSEAIVTVYYLGILDSFSAGYFKPDTALTRGEAVKAISRLVFKETRRKPLYDFSSSKMKKVSFDWNKVYEPEVRYNFDNKRYDQILNKAVLREIPKEKAVFYIYKDFEKDLNFKINYSGTKFDSYITHPDTEVYGLETKYAIDSNGYWHEATSRRMSTYGLPETKSSISVESVKPVTIKYVVFELRDSSMETKLILAPVNIKMTPWVPLSSEKNLVTLEKYFEFDKKTGTITKYSEKGPENVVIPERIAGIPVRCIGRQAFMVYFDNDIKTIVFPKNLEKIDEEAFAYQDKIQSIVLPEKLKYIGDGAFDGCKLKSVKFPKGLKSIGDKAFIENKLTQLELPEGLETIGDGAFMMNEITRVNLPKSLVAIGTSAFFENKLTSITLPVNLKKMGKSVFEKNLINQFSWTCSLKDIPEHLFDNNKISVVYIPDSVETIGTGAFARNQISELKIPSSVKSIGYDAFYNSKLSRLVLPEGITEINEGVFVRNKFTSIQIPDSVSNIGTYAYYWNDITEIKIGANVHLEGEKCVGSYSEEFMRDYEANKLRAGVYKFDEAYRKWIAVN